MAESECGHAHRVQTVRRWPVREGALNRTG
jgi:hypothetical protein